MNKNNKIMFFFLVFLSLNICFISTMNIFSDDTLSADTTENNGTSLVNKNTNNSVDNEVEYNINKPEETMSKEVDKSDQTNIYNGTNNTVKEARKSWTKADGDEFLRNWNYDIWTGTYGGTYFILNYYLGKSTDIEIPGFLYTSNKGNRSVLIRSLDQSSSKYLFRKTGNSPVSYKTMTSVKFSVVNNTSVGVLTGTNSVQGMLQNATDLKSADLSGLKLGNGNNGNYSKISNYSNLFNGCTSLTTVNLPTTDVVNNTSYMFNNCRNLSQIYTSSGLNNFSSFNTSGVTDMSYMFSNTSIPSIPKGLTTNNAINVSHMFDGCLQLTHYNNPSEVGMDLNKVTDMSYMFAGCIGLFETVRMSSSTVTNTSHMFDGCVNISRMDRTYLSGPIRDTSYMFRNCRSIKDGNIFFTNYNTSGVTDMSYMFAGCTSLNNPGFVTMQTSKVTNMSHMFDGCTSLNDSFLSNGTLNTSNVQDMSNMFFGCTGLKNIQPSFNTSNVTNMTGLFSQCTNLSAVTSKFTTSNVRDMSYMFNNCSNLVNANLKSFNTSNVTTMEYMFAGNFHLKNVDVSSFDTSKVTRMYFMFSNTSDLRYIDLSNFVTTNVSQLQYLFNMTTRTNTPLLVVVDKNKSQNLYNYNFSSDYRVPVIYPRLNANGGIFNDSNTTKNYFTRVSYDKNDVVLQKSNFTAWVNQNKPSKSNIPFVRWNISNNADSLIDMILQNTEYVAEWISNPNTSSENTKTGSFGELSIAYIPTKFSTGSTSINLNNNGQQVIPLTNGNHLDVGVRDQRNLSKSWRLNARLIWKNQPQGGGYIRLDNVNVYKNINDGTNVYNSGKDLVSVNDPIKNESITTINTEDTTLMQSTGSEVLNGVYDYMIGQPSLVLTDSSQVAVGNYSANVHWTLVVAP